MAEIKKTSIGGQALIEGVMMKGPYNTAMAVRMPNGKIDTECWENSKKKPFYKKVPFIRGVFNFIESMIVGYKCLSKSAEKACDDEEEEPSGFEKFLNEKFGKDAVEIFAIFGAVLGAAIAILLFSVLPSAAVKLSEPLLPSKWMMTTAEGVLKIVILVIYLWAVSLLPDMKRVFEYHGAEHKTIACYEAGEELTVENIRKYSRFHPRCGTSFLLIVMIISIILFSMISWDNIVIRILLKIVMLPVVMGVSYEVLKLAGRYQNIFTKILSAPGLWLQRLSTREPDDSQIEVAIASMKPVIPSDKDSDLW